MFMLDEMARALATRSEVELHGKKYLVKNATFATDGERVIKMSVVLEDPASVKTIDVDMSLMVY